MSAAAAIPFAPADLVGLPYQLHASSVADGFDCFTLVRFVRAHWFGLATPLAFEQARSATVAVLLGFHHATRSSASRPALWRALEEPAFGCVVGLARFRSWRLHHCGVLIAEGVLHAESCGVVLSPLSRIRDLYARVEFLECQPS